MVGKPGGTQYLVEGAGRGAPAPNRVNNPLQKTASDLGQGDALLALVFAAAVAVRGLADLVGLDEDDLRHALVGVDLGGQRSGVGELERHVPLPLRLQGRDVDDDAAAGVGRL